MVISFDDQCEFRCERGSAESRGNGQDPIGAVAAGAVDGLVPDGAAGSLARHSAAAQATEAAEVALRTLGPGHFLTRGFVENAARICDAWDVADPGNGHERAAAEWRAKLPAAPSGTNPSTAPAATAPIGS
jgi:hypothetical protein